MRNTQRLILLPQGNAIERNGSAFKTGVNVSEKPVFGEKTISKILDKKLFKMGLPKNGR